jgi:hypothetical protein
VHIVTLYDTIFKRRSVRRYNKDLPGDDVIGKITEHISGMEQLNGQRARFEMITGSEANKPAPYYIVAYCEDSTEAYINVGYCMQSFDLYIQSLGLGSLWLGTGRPKNVKADDYCIMMAFGNSDVPFRKGEGDFKRLDVKEISNEDNAAARAARVAPSARNTQPWQLMFGDGLLIRYKGRGLLKGILKKKLSKIDIGIVLRCAELALIQNGEKIKDITISDDRNDLSVKISY